MVSRRARVMCISKWKECSTVLKSIDKTKEMRACKDPFDLVTWRLLMTMAILVRRSDYNEERVEYTVRKSR